MTRLVAYILICIVILSPLTVADDLDVLEEPVGVYVNGGNDSITTAVAELSCFYLRLRGYDPVNLNVEWMGKRRLQERAAIRKRAVRSNVSSFVLLDIQPANKNEKYRWYTRRGFEWIPWDIKKKKEIFHLNLSSNIYANARKKRSTVSDNIKQAVHISTEYSIFGWKSEMYNFNEPLMRMVGHAIDTLLHVIPEKPDTNGIVCTSIPATIVCDRDFRKHHGEERWVEEMAKQVYVANRLLADDIGVALNVHASMSYDLPPDIETFVDLLYHLQTANLRGPEGVILFFSGKHLAPGERSFVDLGILGLSPIIGTRAVVAGLPLHEDETEPWDYLFESLTIVHEIGHMLGAVHTDDHSSIMYPISNIETPLFDDKNKERIKGFVPLFVGGDLFIDSLSYDELIDSLLVIYPDTADMVLALTGILFDHGFDRRFADSSPDIADDYFFSISSGYQLLKHGIDEAARELFLQALDKGPGFGQLYSTIGALYFESDSIETACEYFDMAREAGRSLPEFPECNESEVDEDSTGVEEE